jgi:hypothetical protein
VEGGEVVSPKAGRWVAFPLKRTLYLHLPLAKRGWPIFALSSRLFGKKSVYEEKYTRLSGKVGERWRTKGRWKGWRRWEGLVVSKR